MLCGFPIMALRQRFPSLAYSHIDLQFLRDSPEYDTAKPYHISGLPTHNLEIPRSNIQYQAVRQVPLYNLRGKEAQLSVAEHGFQVMEVPPYITDLDVRGPQKQEYIENVTQMAKSLLEASFALCYDCRVGEFNPAYSIFG